MSDFSTITDLQGATHNVKDATARQALENLSSQVVKSVNEETPDANGNVDIDATDITTSSGVAIKSLTGNPLTIADALHGRALGVNATIEPIQDLHGYDKPWVGGAGKNILPKATSVTWGGIDFVVADDGKISATGTSKATAFGNAGAFTLSAGTYILNGCPANSQSITMDIRNAQGGSGIVSGADSGNGLTFTLSTETSGVVNIRIPSGVTVDNLVFKPMIRLASETDPTFKPYSNICPISGISTLEIANGETTEVTVALGQTVYGGTLNVSTGELVVDRAIVDMGTLSWEPIQRGDQFAFYTSGINTLKKIGIYNLISSSYKTVGVGYGYEFSNMVNGDISGQSANGNVFVKNDNFPYTTSGARDFKNAVSGVQMVYELATPLTFNLTPAQLNLLSSTNILTTNAEELTVRYYATGQQGNVEGNIAFLLGQTASNASTITALSESVAPIETGTATQNYSVGDYLLLNGQFCKVTASIATGETITVGTNVAETSVGNEITVIESQMGTVSGMNYATRAVRKIGRLVQLNVVIDSTENTLECQGWGSIIIGTLPSEYRPSTLTNFPLLIATKAGAWINVMIRISTSGYVVVADNIVGNTFIPRTIFLNAFWIQ